MENLVVLENGELELASDVKQTIFAIEKEIKNLKELSDKYKKALIEEIEARGMTKCSIKNELFTLSYKAPTTRETLDSKSLKADMPEIYDEYVKISDVSSSISVRLKEME
jgi:hypothetical protein